jgi:hypothetical protein
MQERRSLMDKSGTMNGVCSTVTRSSLAVVAFMFSCVLDKGQESKTGMDFLALADPLVRDYLEGLARRKRGGERARKRLVCLVFFYGED